MVICAWQLHNVTLALELLSERDMQVDNVDPQGKATTTFCKLTFVFMCCHLQFKDLERYKKGLADSKQVVTILLNCDSALSLAPGYYSSQGVLC